MKSRREKRGLVKKDIVSYMKKRGRQLIFPYYIWGSILILFYQLLHIIAGESLTIKKQLFALLTGQGIDSLWFIPCYLFAEMLFVFFFIRLSRWKKRICTVTGFAIIFLCSYYRMRDVWLLRLPSLVVGYSVKARGIARSLFGTEENYVLPAQELKEPGQLCDKFQWLMLHYNEIREHLVKMLPHYLEQGREVMRDVFERLQ